MKQPNIVFVFGDQWRAQATGYAGNPNVQTPHIDNLAQDSVNFRNALSGCPVCSPYRASLLTGQRPLTHGVFVNDVPLRPKGPSLAETFAAAGYDTAYIGKWHIEGHGRSRYIPRRFHLGFDYWKVLECTHEYNESAHYEDDSPEKKFWEGYDAIAQTRDAQAYLRRTHEKPFLLMLSWGPPHAPYQTAPEEFRALYDPAKIQLRPNVPDDVAEKARTDLAGYYAHCTALDTCLGELLDTLRDCGLEDDTIFIFTSDHGDMHYSQGQLRKQRPWEESIRVPFLLRYTGHPDWQPRTQEAPIDAPDIMPTLLGLCDVPIPDSVEGLDYSDYVMGGPDPSDGSALLACPHPFGQWTKRDHGGCEYRGLRTNRYTYTRNLDGPWLLYDNEKDPYQMENLVDRPDYAEVRKELDSHLQRRLAETNDEFLPGMEYINRWGYEVDERGTVPYIH